MLNDSLQQDTNMTSQQILVRSSVNWKLRELTLIICFML
jgi:hypothetical protein